MTSGVLASAIGRLCESAGLDVGAPVVDTCAAYLTLLRRWNQRMNLTALPMGDVVPDQTIQKLIIEPLCAASLVTGFSGDWLDLGSGGGSPALPLRAALSSTHSLSLVESRGRKCAFLREAARQLEFGGVSVLDCRFDEMPATEADLVTFRAVRVDEGFLRVVLRHLRPGGVVLAFGSSVHHSELTQVDSSALPDGSTVLKLVRRT